METPRVRLIPCGDYVNESERTAAETLRTKLQGCPGPWVLLSNLNHTAHPAQRADEIDLVVIGPPGVLVVEVKHWDLDYLKRNPEVVAREAERIYAKAKRIAGKLRQRFDPGFVDARLLLTRGLINLDETRRPKFQGVAVYGLPEWEALVSIGRIQLSAQQIEQAALLLAPGAKITLKGQLRSFAGLINLERISDLADTFHRVYRGQHPTRRDKAILHLYDLSASTDKKARELAQREFDTIQRQ